MADSFATCTHWHAAGSVPDHNHLCVVCKLLSCAIRVVGDNDSEERERERKLLAARCPNAMHFSRIIICFH